MAMAAEGFPQKLKNLCLEEENLLDSLLRKALEHIRAYHFMESLQCLSVPLEHGQASAYKSFLEKAIAAVENLSFDEAQVCLLQFSEKSGGAANEP